MTGCVLPALLCGLLAVLICRTLAFRPKAEPAAQADDAEHPDVERAAAALSAMIRCRTVSSFDPSAVQEGRAARNPADEAEFRRLRALLPELYPCVHQALELHSVGESGLLYRWRGRREGGATVLMAHYDVVPADETLWRQPPFEGRVVEGVLWGRGALDTKQTLCGILEAAEALLAEGFTPERDVYLSFSGDEEVSGPTAPAIAAWLAQRGVRPALVLDEGGAVVTGAFPGVSQPTAVIGTGEKGSLVVELSVSGKGGHASAPGANAPLTALLSVIRRIEKKPFPMRLTPAALGMLDALGRRSTPLYRLLFGNLWLFSPVLNLVCRARRGEMDALVRTTCAFTIVQGGDAANVIPAQARAVANLRLLPGDTPQRALARLRRVAACPQLQMKVHYSQEASPHAPASGEAWERVRAAVRAAWPQAAVSPYLMLAASDSRHFCGICACVYRFSAVAMDAELRGGIHGVDERIPLAELARMLVFFRRMLRAS